MNVERLTLDTNILVYAFDKDAGKRHGLARKVVERVVTSDCVLTLQALCEFFNTVTRKGKLPFKIAYDRLQDLEVLFPIVSAKPSTLSRAIKTAALHQISFWDAMLWATARDADVKLLLSEDFQHNRLLDGIRIINPFRPNDVFSVV